MRDKCIIAGCDHPRRTLGYCLVHWRTWKSNPAGLLFVTYPPVRRVYTRTPLLDRFHTAVLLSDEACYDWSGLKSRLGYGLIRYHVDPSTISNIMTRDTWTHI